MDALTGGTSQLPESPEDSRFLLEIPDDFDMTGACLRLQEMYKDPITEIKAGLVAAIKIVLKLKSKRANDEVKATRVILNAIDESQKLCGYTSPETILMLLKTRRNRVKELLASTPSAE